MAKRDVVTLDDAIFQKKIRDLARRVKVDEKEFVREQGGLFMRDVAKFVPPYEKYPTGRGTKIGNKKDQIQGEKAIWSDMKILYKIRERGYLAALHQINGSRRRVQQNLTNKKGVSYAVDVDYINYSSTGEALDFHESRRRSDGRVKNKHQGKKANDRKIGRWKSRNVMWITKEIWLNVFDVLAARVGMAKAAAAKAAIKMDPARAKDVPLWVRRHLSTAKGSGRMAQIRGSWSAVMKAEAAGLQHVRPSVLARIKRGRLKAMESRLLYIAKDNAKKAGFAVK